MRPPAYPLVVGEASEVSTEATGQPGGGLTRVWQPLLHTPAYKEAVAALPDTVPVATLAVVDAICGRELGVPLASALAGATVRQLLLGSPSADAEQHLPGLLGYDACILEGPVLMLDALVRARALRAVRHGAAQPVAAPVDERQHSKLAPETDASPEAFHSTSELICCLCVLQEARYASPGPDTRADARFLARRKRCRRGPPPSSLPSSTPSALTSLQQCLAAARERPPRRL
jgi:hypothetical protein